MPRLEATAGPLQGAIFPLTEEEASIGREPSNQLSILDASVSRQHCLIRREDQRFRVRDLESRNGTFVNGVPIKERLLEDGDEIRIGNCLFLFLMSEDDRTPSSESVRIEEGEIAARSTVELRREPVLDTKPLTMLGTAPPTVRAARDLSVLLRISRAMSSTRGLEALERQLLELVFEVAPADRGAILLAGERTGEFTSVFGWDRQTGQNRPVAVSRAVIDRVIQRGVALLSHDLSGLEGICSLMAVPLEVFHHIRGVLYLDTGDPAVRFDEDLLQLLNAIGGIAAMALENARRLEWLESENRRLQAEFNIEHNMVGESHRMQEIHQFIAKVGPRESTVLICGESGTGKELVARAIHRNGPRAAKPFVAINCAALAEALLESELFGHEKGAFTGAVAQKKGKLEVADGGTVFLDEVSELAPALQAKLLRVLQEREFEHLGGTRPISVDIRLVAATNRNLSEAVAKGAFRQDLYYRLNVVSVTMPPLRERREDIPLLASYFAAKYGAQCRRSVVGMSPEARACLMHYDWPGNVRELENAIERAVVLGASDLILPEDLPEAVLEKGGPSCCPADKYHWAVQEAKRQLILKAIEQAKGNYTEAASSLGLQRTYLHRLMRNLDLKPGQKKS